MRIVLDACVLFPTVLREILIGTAATGAFTPLWSARILEEWARATRRLPSGSEAVARTEIAILRAGLAHFRDRVTARPGGNPLAA